MKENGIKFAERFMYPGLYAINPNLIKLSSSIEKRIEILQSMNLIEEVSNEIPGFFHILCQICDAIMKIWKTPILDIEEIISWDFLKKLIPFIQFEDVDIQGKVIEIFINMRFELLNKMSIINIQRLIEEILINFSTKNMSEIAINNKKMNIKILELKFFEDCMHIYNLESKFFINVVDKFCEIIEQNMNNKEFTLACCKFIENFSEKNYFINMLNIKTIDSIAEFLIKNIQTCNFDIVEYSIKLMISLINNRSDFENLTKHNKIIQENIFECLGYLFEHRIYSDATILITSLINKCVENYELFLHGSILGKWFNVLKKSYSNKEIFHVNTSNIVIYMPHNLEHKKLIIKNGYIEYVKHFSKKELLVNYFQNVFAAGLKNITQTIDAELENLLFEHDFVETFKKYLEIIRPIYDTSIPVKLKMNLHPIIENCMRNSEKLRKEFIKNGIDKISDVSETVEKSIPTLNK